MRSIPNHGADLFSDDVLSEPDEHYRAIRDLGPVVHLDAHDVLAVSRYADVRTIRRPTARGSASGSMRS